MWQPSNSPEVAAASLIANYFAMAEEPNKVSPAAADLHTFGSATAMMTANKLAMFVSGGWDKTSLDQAGCNYGMALIPGNHTSYICASGYAIGANCKNPEAAWEVIKLLTGAEASQKRVELEAALPTIETDLEAYKNTLSDNQKAFITTLDYGVQPIGMRSVLGSKINEKTTEIFENIIFHTADTGNFR